MWMTKGESAANICFRIQDKLSSLMMTYTTDLYHVFMHNLCLQVTIPNYQSSFLNGISNGVLSQKNNCPVYLIFFITENLPCLLLI
jgi:hypothetical protein